jgi:hypothetical protein
MSRLDTDGFTALPAYTGMTLREFNFSPNGCHSRVSGQRFIAGFSLLIQCLYNFKAILKFSIGNFQIILSRQNRNALFK